MGEANNLGAPRPNPLAFHEGLDNMIAEPLVVVVSSTRGWPGTSPKMTESFNTDLSFGLVLCAEEFQYVNSRPSQIAA